MATTTAILLLRQGTNRSRNAAIMINFPTSGATLSHIQRASWSSSGAGGVLRSFSSASSSPSGMSKGEETSPSTTSPQAISPDQNSSDHIIPSILELSKAKLSTLVVSTASFGFLAAGGPISWPTLAACCAGTALCSSSASTWNQIFEVERDTKMKRTAHRPLVKGTISPANAKLLGTMTGVTGGTVLLYGTDPITAMLGVGNIALYSGLYTYLKPRSEINTWVGAVVGAIPPVMGWTAAGGSPLDTEALLMGSTLFLWQFPHFFALSWMHRIDYGRGGFQMVPVNDIQTKGDRTAGLIMRYTGYLSTVPILSTVLDVTSPMFAIEGIALNAYAFYVAKQFDNERSNSNARKVFLTSLWYLPSFMVLFILHSKTWKNEEKLDDENAKEEWNALLKKWISDVRSKGKELCVHEVVISKTAAEEQNSHGDDKEGVTNGGNKCPVMFSKSTAKSSVEVAKKTAAVAANATKGIEVEKQ
mmetsp:Transcript_28822/g.42463  ORF Transcript_28822/g.42463 Transcript_28822/m.42463 type:complete len:475 (+) Transcript_28822:1170-2594(+)